jgi:hypothetical protein
MLVSLIPTEDEQAFTALWKATDASFTCTVTGDSAYPVQEPTDCLSAHANDVHACDTLRSGAIDESGLPAGAFDDHNRREQQVVEQNGARYVSVTSWFCTDTVCPAVIGGLAVYRDAFHISPNYAYWLSGALATAMELTR